MKVFDLNGGRSNGTLVFTSTSKANSCGENNRLLSLVAASSTHQTEVSQGVRWLSSEGVGLVIRRLPDRFPAMPNDVVSLGKALHPTCLGGYVPVALDKSVC